jgi:hypothetical protein
VALSQQSSEMRQTHFARLIPSPGSEDGLQTALDQGGAAQGRAGRIRVPRELIRFVATDVFDYHRPSRCRLQAPPVRAKSHHHPDRCT